SKATSAESITIPAGSTLEEAEKIVIEQTLAANKGNKSKTAELLGIGRKTLQRKLGEADFVDQ
ncbi:MAG: sigma-54-dependent Fis family transcriptional regulator, partial [Treponema sp.]|nr:sigma-54-dependent Fis family transcriptional regulator [Treponema sp.]